MSVVRYLINYPLMCLIFTNREACEKYWGEDLKDLVVNRGKNNKGKSNLNIY